AAMGYYLHSVVPEEQLMATVMKYSREFGYFFIFVGMLIVVFFVYKGVKKK
ncbi:MAG: DedA family protein, partial [Bacteroides sp.]|nr:DedA family protein [Bacteroides sp.]